MYNKKEIKWCFIYKLFKIEKESINSSHTLLYFNKIQKTIFINWSYKKFIKKEIFGFKIDKNMVIESKLNLIICNDGHYYFYEKKSFKWIKSINKLINKIIIIPKYVILYLKWVDGRFFYKFCKDNALEEINIEGVKINEITYITFNKNYLLLVTNEVNIIILDVKTLIEIPNCIILLFNCRVLLIIVNKKVLCSFFFTFTYNNITNSNFYEFKNISTKNVFFIDYLYIKTNDIYEIYDLETIENQIQFKNDVIINIIKYKTFYLMEKKSYYYIICRYNHSVINEGYKTEYFRFIVTKNFVFIKNSMNNFNIFCLKTWEELYMKYFNYNENVLSFDETKNFLIFHYKDSIDMKKIKIYYKNSLKQLNIINKNLSIEIIGFKEFKDFIWIEFYNIDKKLIQSKFFNFIKNNKIVKIDYNFDNKIFNNILHNLNIIYWNILEFKIIKNVIIIKLKKKNSYLYELRFFCLKTLNEVYTGLNLVTNYKMLKDIIIINNMNLYLNYASYCFKVTNLKQFHFDGNLNKYEKIISIKKFKMLYKLEIKNLKNKKEYFIFVSKNEICWKINIINLL